MRKGVALVVLVLAVPAGDVAADAAVPAYYWPVTKVMRKLHGARITVNGRTVRIDEETTLCSGRGRSRRVRGARAWRSFVCTYTTFTRAGVDKDLDFRVWIVDGRRMRTFGARWVGTIR